MFKVYDKKENINKIVLILINMILSKTTNFRMNLTNFQSFRLKKHESLDLETSILGLI